MSKRKSNDSEDDADETNPKLFRLLYRAFQYLLADRDDTANRYWERARRRVKKRRMFHDVDEVKFKEDGFLLPLHLAIQHAAPCYLIKALVDNYTGGCSVAFNDEMPLQMACGYPKMASRVVIKDLRYDTDWENVILLLMRKNPAAIDATKNTALHLVLEHNPSLKLVQNMIDLHQSSRSFTTSSSSKAGKKKNKRKRKKKDSLLQMKDEESQLPLHVAVEHVASADVVLKILRSFPAAAKLPRDKHDGSLPLHCAVSFGCSGSVLTHIIRAHPDALSATENSGNTPLHLLFHMETNTKRWNIKDKSDDFDGDAPLSETAICQLLLEYIPVATISLSLLIKNRSGHTVVKAADQCAKVFDVPDGLVRLLKEAEGGKITSRTQPAQRTGVDIDLTARDPFDMSTDEGSNDSESDTSSDDLSDSECEG